MPSLPDHPDIYRGHRPELLLFCGWAGILGSIASPIAMIWAWTVTGHSMIADTISDLGRGEHRVIMDTGFYIYAAGLLSLAIGTAHLHLGRFRWSVSVFALAGLALVVTMVGLWDAFGRTAPDDVWLSVHTQLTFALGPLYLIGPLLMVKQMKHISTPYAVMFVIAAIGFIVFATWFKLAPDAYDGILEKIATAFTMLWTIPLGWFLVRYARE
ncbi:MAG: DUF998 domain-containing protein, partial [Shimia sp.]